MALVSLHHSIRKSRRRTGFSFFIPDDHVAVKQQRREKPRVCVLVTLSFVFCHLFQPVTANQPITVVHLTYVCPAVSASQASGSHPSQSVRWNARLRTSSVLVPPRWHPSRTHTSLWLVSWAAMPMRSAGRGIERETFIIIIGVVILEVKLCVCADLVKVEARAWRRPHGIRWRSRCWSEGGGERRRRNEGERRRRWRHHQTELKGNREIKQHIFMIIKLNLQFLQ